MLFNANSGHGHCSSGVPCGGHAWSKDGLTWSIPTIPAFGTIVHYQDGTTVDWDYVERPQVVQDDVELGLLGDLDAHLPGELGAHPVELVAALRGDDRPVDFEGWCYQEYASRSRWVHRRRAIPTLRTEAAPSLCEVVSHTHKQKYRRLI